jgi:hypothetical protein
MLADQFLEAASAARTTHALDQLARQLWRAHGERQIDDADASAVSEAVQARRRDFAAGEGFRRPSRETAACGPRRAGRRPPNRRASVERRRRQAMSGAMPPALAARFTMGEAAVLAVVARTCQRMQVCVLAIDAIAALAGVERTTAKNAMREARRLGLIEVRERRIPGQKSLTNVVKIIAPDWLAWLRHRPEGIGVKKSTPRVIVFSLRGARRSEILTQGHLKRGFGPTRGSSAARQRPF